MSATGVTTDLDLAAIAAEIMNTSEWYELSDWRSERQRGFEYCAVALEHYVRVMLYASGNIEIHAYANGNEVPFRIEFLTPIFGAILKSQNKRIVDDSYLDALEALLDAGSCIGLSDGRWAREGLWQNAEDEKDAAREEMGL